MPHHAEPDSSPATVRAALISEYIVHACCTHRGHARPPNPPTWAVNGYVDTSLVELSPICLACGFRDCRISVSGRGHRD